MKIISTSAPPESVSQVFGDIVKALPFAARLNFVASNIPVYLARNAIRAQVVRMGMGQLSDMVAGLAQRKHLLGYLDGVFYEELHSQCVLALAIAERHEAELVRKDDAIHVLEMDIDRLSDEIRHRCSAACPNCGE